MRPRSIRALVLFALALLCAASPAVAQTPEPLAATAFSLPEGTRFVAISPDGARIAGLKGDGLCIYPIGEQTPTACADLGAHKIRPRLDDIVWSPDGRSIVIAETAFQTFVDGDLWLVDTETGDIRDLTDDGFNGPIPFGGTPVPGSPTPLIDVSPAWSPDSTQIAFSRTTFTFPGDKPNDLAILDVATGKVRTLARISPTEPGVLYLRMAWSPDGKTIYATVGHADKNNPDNGVWAYDAATGTGRQVAGTADENVAYPAVLAVSPRGDALLVDYPFVLGSYAGMKPGYGVLDLRSGAIALLTPPDAVNEPGTFATTPVFTRDGGEILTILRRGDGPGTLGAYDAAGGEGQAIGELPASQLPFSYDRGMVLTASGTLVVPTALTGGLVVPLPAGLAGAPAPEATPNALSSLQTP